MPQAPKELQDMWGDMETALAHLRPNYMQKAGVISPKQDYFPNDKDWSAINYLWLEWDFGYADAPDPEAVPL